MGPVLAEVVDVEVRQVRMMEEQKCPICLKIVYSGVGSGCQMCGMLLENTMEEFCCKICRRKHSTINKRFDLASFIVNMGYYNELILLSIPLYHKLTGNRNCYKILNE